jgi:hypothetical protein
MAYHRRQYVLPVATPLRARHSNRVRQVGADEYGASGEPFGTPKEFLGAHGLSFLTVV